MKGILQQYDQTGMLALIVATPTSGIPGRSLVVSSSTDDMGYFELNLVEGLEYRWSIYQRTTPTPHSFSTKWCRRTIRLGRANCFANPEELQAFKAA